VQVSLLAYSLKDHDLLTAQGHETEDFIEALQDEITDLKAVIKHAQEEQDLHGIELKKETVQADIYKSQIPGFWQKHFGQCFWTGVVSGYATSEIINNDN
jgi:hypothetical protein